MLEVDVYVEDVVTNIAYPVVESSREVCFDLICFRLRQPHKLFQRDTRNTHVL